MNKRITALSLMALAAWVAAPGLPTTAQAQDGPVRQGLRNTAQGAAQAASRAGQATRNVAEGAARGAAEAARRTGNAARNVAEGARNTVRNVAPPYQGQYSSGYRGNAYYNNGSAYYNSTPGNYQGQGYSQSGWTTNGYANGGVHQLRYDSCGREWICVNGQRVYVTQSTMTSQGQPADSQQQSPDMAPPAPNSDEQDSNLQNEDQQANQQPADVNQGVQQRFNAQAAEAAAQSELRASQNQQGVVIDGQAGAQGGQADGLDTPAPPANADAQATGPADAGFDIDASPNE